MSLNNSIFATKSCKYMQNSTDIFSLESTLSLFLDCIVGQIRKQAPFLQAITSIFCGQITEDVMLFALDDERYVLLAN